VLARNHVAQGVNEQIGAVSAIEAKLHLLQIGGKMFGADLVPRAIMPRFKEKTRIRRVSRDARAVLVAGVFLGVVVDGFVFHVANSGLVSGQFVRDDYVHIGADVFLDVLCQRSLRASSAWKKRTSRRAVECRSQLVWHDVRRANCDRSLATFRDIGFVHFDRTVQHRRSTSFMAARMRWQRYHAVL